MRSDYTFVEGAKFAWELMQTISDMSCNERMVAFGEDSISCILWDNSVREVADMMDKYEELCSIGAGTEITWNDNGVEKRGIVIEADEVSDDNPEMTVLTYSCNSNAFSVVKIPMEQTDDDRKFELTGRDFNSELTKLIDAFAKN